jgi:hypothetical protein
MAYTDNKLNLNKKTPKSNQDSQFLIAAKIRTPISDKCPGKTICICHPCLTDQILDFAHLRGFEHYLLCRPRNNLQNDRAVMLFSESRYDLQGACGPIFGI